MWNNANVTFNVSRTITPEFFNDESTASSLVYTPKISNKAGSGYNENGTLVSVNYEALNLYWQMQNLPTFLSAW